MKKFVIALLILAICATCLFAFVACNDGTQLTMYVPDGAPALAVANVLQTGKMGNLNVNTTITTGEDVVAKCASGAADMAILPINAAATICSKNDNYKLLTVNTWGLLYVVGTNNITNLDDLKGKSLMSIGLANTPEYVFKKILDVNSIQYTAQSDSLVADKVNIQYVTDGTTVVQSIMQAVNTNKEQYGLLGEPAATNVIAKAAQNSKTVYRLFNLQQLWQDATNSSRTGYPQAGMIVKTELLTKQNVNQILQCLTDNLDFVAINAPSLAQLMTDNGSTLTVNYTAEIVERCNLAVVNAKDVKQDIYAYLQQFSAQNIQNLLPTLDAIYYE